MTTITRNTDGKARLCLPQSFANSTVIIEPISDTELRLRKARVIPEDELRFPEETAAPLSDKDRDLFLKALAKPPRANKALRKAAAKYKSRHG